MTVEQREQRWAEAMRAERRGEAVTYEHMLKEVATALRRSLAPRLVRAGLGAHEAEDLVQEILIGLHGKRHTWDSARPFLPWLHAIARYKLIVYSAGRIINPRTARSQMIGGIELLRGALGILRAQQYNLQTTRFIGTLAEGLRKTGQFEEALVAVNGAIARAKNSGVEFYLSELLRIKSQILAAQHDREPAMNCLTEALAVARAQSALAWELRSTMALARMLSEGGQPDRARHTLALVYDRFTEGFETADLKLARALLEDLR
jgi:hypothetical protein